MSKEGLNPVNKPVNNRRTRYLCNCVLFTNKTIERRGLTERKPMLRRKRKDEK